MDVFYKPKALERLNAKIAYAKGEGSRRLAVDIAAALELGNEADRLRGVDRYGRPQKPVKKRKGVYAGKTGPPLVPSGSASRAIRSFSARVKGSRPPYTVLAGWKGVVSSRGVPFLPFLDRDRPIFGVSPATWRLIRERISEFKRDFMKSR